MKKVKSIIVVSVLTLLAAGFTIKAVSSNDNVDMLLIENVEALANTETGGKLYQSMAYCPGMGKLVLACTTRANAEYCKMGYCIVNR